MSGQSSPTSSGGIGFTGLLVITFIVLKLTGAINWSWVWMLSPIWISLGISLGIVAVFLVGAGVVLLSAAIFAWCADRFSK